MDERLVVSRLLRGGVWLAAAMMAAGLVSRHQELISWGTVVLIATPPLRVVALGLSWTKARDWRFALVSWSVLALLAAGYLLGAKH